MKECEDVMKLMASFPYLVASNARTRTTQKGQTGYIQVEYTGIVVVSGPGHICPSPNCVNT